MSNQIRTGFLAPDITEENLRGEQPINVSLKRLQACSPLRKDANGARRDRLENSASSQMPDWLARSSPAALIELSLR
jgi:hypothetical protein